MYYTQNVFMTYKMNMAYTRLNITIPKETLEKLKKIAENEKRSLSNMITYLIEKY